MSIQEQQRRSGFLSTADLRAGARRQGSGSSSTTSPPRQRSGLSSTAAQRSGRGQPANPFSSYAPGAAQSLPPPSQGTPYGAYSPGASQNLSGGNLAYAAPQNRPQPFTASYQGFDGSVSNQPNFAQRDAFINQINNQLGRQQAQSWQQPTGAPQFDFPSMWNQAGKMVEQGWQNPFSGFGQTPVNQPTVMPRDYRPPGAAQPTPPPSQGTPYSPGGQSSPGYGRPPGTGRSMDVRDRDRDGIDDRDQDGPGQSPYGGRRPGKNFNPRNSNKLL